MFISCIIFKRSMGWTNPKRCLLNHNIMCNTTINNNFSESEAENRFGKNQLKRKLRALPGCRCQIAQNHHQKERDLTMKCTQLDRSKAKTNKHMASETTFTTDDISTRHATPSLLITHLPVDDNSRL